MTRRANRAVAARLLMVRQRNQQHKLDEALANSNRLTNR
jgi:hypothetical protein